MTWPRRATRAAFPWAAHSLRSPASTGPDVRRVGQTGRRQARLCSAIQIVKGWLDGDDYQVQVYDIAGDANNGATVDLDTCETQGDGFGDLCSVWQDPDFDPAQRAYYYARVLENPTCRWTTWQCSPADYDCNDWDFEARRSSPTTQTIRMTGLRRRATTPAIAVILPRV